VKEISPAFNVPDNMYSKTLYQILSKSVEYLWRRNIARNRNDPAIVSFCYMLLAEVIYKNIIRRALYAYVQHPSPLPA
jgi:hypothetical protein